MNEPQSTSGASEWFQASGHDSASWKSPAQSSIAAPSPIRFTRAICGDLGQAERREWWIANGLGVYGGGTIAGSLTCRCHGLLIAPVASLLGRRLIVAKADAWTGLVANLIARLAAEQRMSGAPQAKMEQDEPGPVSSRPLPA